MSLDSATVALEHRDFAAALSGLWPIWKQTRDPTVALAVVLADHAAAPLPESWRSAKRAEMHALWLSHSKLEAPPLGWLAATWSQGTLAQSLARLEWMRSAPADPRLTLAMSAALVSPPFHSFNSANVLYEPLLATLGALKEPASLLQVERSLRLPPWTGAQMRALITPGLEALAATLRARAHSTAVSTPRLQQALEPLRSDFPDLLPVDDLPRLQVAADALQERGDPRGAVLATQLALLNGASAEGLTLAKHAAQTQVARRSRKEASGTPRRPVLDPEERLVGSETALEVLLQPEARWRAREVVVSYEAMSVSAAARLAKHPGLLNLETLRLHRPMESAQSIAALLAALDVAPLNDVLKTLEVWVSSASDQPLTALARWLSASAFRAPSSVTSRRLKLASVDCVLTRAKGAWARLSCRSHLAEGHPDYVSLFKALELPPEATVHIEREWMQPPRRGQVLEAAKQADLVLTFG